MKKSLLPFLLLSLLFIPLKSEAYVLKSDDFIYVAKDEVVEGNLYFYSKSLNIEGKVLGDVIGVSPNIQINGYVEGDVISISQNISVNGEINGNLRSASNNLNIAGNIARNVNFLGDSFLLKKDASIGQSVSLIGINSEINGEVMGSVHGLSQNTLIRGSIARDLNITVDSKKRRHYSNTLEISETATILGSLSYRSGQEALVHSENIGGSIIKKDPRGSALNFPSARKFIFSILSSFLVALLLLYLFKDKIERIKKVIIRKNYRTMGYGAIIFFLSPVIIILLLASIIGLPVALISLALWLILSFLSRVVVALAVGDYFFELIKKESASPYLKMLSGIIILWALFALPYAGWLFSLATVLLGLGSFFYIIKKKKHAN
jgi:cytoskeletal protein CcmA (bactofilin family)